VGAAGAAETGRGRPDDGRAAALERVGRLALDLAAARPARMGIPRVSRGLRSRRVTRAGVGLTSRCAGSTRRPAGGRSDLGFASGLGAYRRRTHVGLSGTGITARRRTRGRGGGPVVGCPACSSPGVEATGRRRARRCAQRSGLESTRRSGMGRSSGGLVARCSSAAAEHRRLGRIWSRGPAAGHGRAFLGTARGEPGCPGARLGRSVGRARLGRAEDRRTRGSRVALVGWLAGGRRSRPSSDAHGTAPRRSTLEPACGGGLEPACGGGLEPACSRGL
jgi:hypothetical protein